MPDQASALYKMGVDLLGLNFHPDSPRFVDTSRARELIQNWSDPKSIVGVFVNRTAEEVLKIRDLTGIGIAQLHGDESAETVARIGSEMPVIRAFRIRDQDSLTMAQNQIKAIADLGCNLKAVLIDGYSANAHGGTGVTVAESLVRSSNSLHSKVILAGGLTAVNLHSRLSWITPWAVDVASGVESSPGIKDLQLVAEMLKVIAQKT